MGLGDIGIVTTIFHSSKLPSQGISGSTPFVASDARAIAQAVDEIVREFPAMNNEFEDQNQVYLATGVVLDSYQMFCSDEVASTADLDGLKVAGAGLNLRYLEVLQAVAVDYRDHLAGIAMDRGADSGAAYIEAGGTIIEVFAQDRAAWANDMPNIAQE